MSRAFAVRTLWTAQKVFGRTHNGQLPKGRLYSAVSPLIVGSARQDTKSYHLNFGFTSLLASSTGYPRMMTTKIDDAAAPKLPGPLLELEKYAPNRTRLLLHM